MVMLATFMSTCFVLELGCTIAIDYLIKSAWCSVS